MNRGKNFNLYLMDGDVTGRIKCTLSNWTGIAYKIPVKLLDTCKEREDLKQSGIYFLFGENDDGEKIVYIGQAGIRKNGEGVLCRVKEHFTSETDFNETVILTTQNNSFGPTEISYLENRFTNIAKKTSRYKVRNGNEPNLGNVTEEKESELEEYIEYSEMVLGVLGYKIFVPLVDRDKKKAAENTFRLKRNKKNSNREINATCIRTNEGFVVLKGSDIEEMDADHAGKAIILLKEELKKQGYIKDGKLLKDQLFSKPSAASCFVLGASSNGNEEWKRDGIKLGEIIKRENK